MRKFKRFPLRGLRFRSLLILTGALLLVAAFASSANADLIAYYNFEGAATSPYPVNLDSHPPAVFFSSDNTLSLSTGADPSVPTVAQGGTAYPSANTLSGAGINLNIAAPPVVPNDHSLGADRSKDHILLIDIPLFSAQGFFQQMTVSFALNVAGNAYNAVSLWYSTDHGVSFTMATGQTFSIPPSGATVVTFNVPTAANNKPGLELRLAFTGGQSNGQNDQDLIDNIQINGTIVPEPATVAGGLLGVLGLCWHQRRRLRLILPRSRRG